MGNPMAQHIFKRIGKLKVFNLPHEKTKNLVEMGCEVATPAEMGASCDVVVTMVSKPSDLESTILEPQTGVLAHAKRGLMLLDHTTSSPSLAKRIAIEAAARGVGSVDAPVTGADVGAKSGKLKMMAGGTTEDFNRVRPVFDCYTNKAYLFGPAGAGQHAKVANQISVAGALIGTCETLLYAQRAGLEASALVDMVKDGTGGSFVMANFGPRILAENFEPGVTIDNFVKDLEIALEECSCMKLSLPGVTTVHMLIKLYRELGNGQRGAHGLIQVLRRLNGLEGK